MALQILIVGQLDRSESAPLAAWISQSLAPATTRTFQLLTDALDSAERESWIPDLAIVLQSWSDEYSGVEIERLSQLAPLARLVVCYGAWCESDGRTRDLWPLAVRVPMHLAPARLQREWNLLIGKPAIAVPMSASREEIFGADHSGLEHEPAGVSVYVDSPDSEYRRYLEDLLMKAGCTTTCGPTSVLVFDCDPWSDQRRIALQSMLDEAQRERVLAMVSQPDPVMTAELLGLGMCEVLPKLCDQQRILHAVVSNESTASIAE